MVDLFCFINYPPAVDTATCFERITVELRKKGKRVCATIGLNTRKMLNRTQHPYSLFFFFKVFASALIALSLINTMRSQVVFCDFCFLMFGEQ